MAEDTPAVPNSNGVEVEALAEEVEALAEEVEALAEEVEVLDVGVVVPVAEGAEEEAVAGRKAKLLLTGLVLHAG